MIKASVLFLVLATGFLTGCTSVTSQSTPTFDRSKVKNVWVERRLADNNNVRDRLVRALEKRGFQAEAGPLTLMPEQGIDVVLGYEDRWDWNFGNYMVQLRVELRHPRTSELFARAFLERTTFFGKSTDEMVNRVVTELFRERTVKTK